MPPQGPPPQGLPPGQPPHQPPPGWNNPMLDNDDDNYDPNRKKNRRKNKNKNQGIAPSLPPEAGSLAPGSPMQEVQVPTWGTNVGAVNDEEAKTMSRNRQYGYAIMACAVVALAVLMVSSVTFRDRYYTIFVAFHSVGFSCSRKLALFKIAISTSLRTLGGSLGN